MNAPSPSPGAVTVYIPCHNAEKYLAGCVNALPASCRPGKDPSEEGSRGFHHNLDYPGWSDGVFLQDTVLSTHL
jgi:hypothetical protein